MTVPTNEPETGTLLGGRYRLDARLGTGGMGTVWKAFDQRLHRPVAVKLIRTGGAPGRDDRDLFRREARAAAVARHRGIITVHDVDADAEVPYLVMELLAGPDVRTLLDTAGGPLTVPDAVRLGAEVADALAHAHELGVVHRDLKPGNLVLDAYGRVKICDFGIARFRRGTLTRLSLTSASIMTLGYAAPEQLLGEEVDARADLYALGCILYELLTGRKPFTGSAMEVTEAHVYEEPPSPAVRRPDIPGPVAELVLRLLAKSPADRPATAGVVRDVLRGAVVPGSGVPAPVEDSAVAEMDTPTEDGAAAPTVPGPRDRPGRPGDPVLWRHPLTACGPLAVGEGMVVATDWRGTIAALDSRTGRERWSRRDKAGFYWIPAVHRGMVVSVCKGPLDGLGRISAMELGTGRVRWQRDLGHMSDTAPACVGRRVLVSTFHHTVRALDIDSGRNLWVYESGMVSSTRAGVDGHVVVFRTTPGLRGHDLEDGRELWSAESREGGTGRTAVVTAEGRAFFADVRSIGSVDTRSGRRLWLWQDDFWVKVGPIVGPGGLVIAALSDADYRETFIVALDARDGRLVWLHTNPDRDPQGLAVHGDLVVVTCQSTGTNGEELLFALDIADGRRVWQWKPNYGIAEPAAVSDGVAYVPCTDGVYAVALPS
ncbi:protein kinase [Kitasatospora sp. NPDC093806]|uniref:protein kinase domain-containing protein n=1 Tax=Kitasatospora sp. NPDC093806 TaxID=3155075 RepID=UPI00342C9FC4